MILGHGLLLRYWILIGWRLPELMILFTLVLSKVITCKIKRMHRYCEFDVNNHPVTN